MKIKQANVYVVETGSFRPILVELSTDEGICGIGEGSVGFGIGCHAAATMIKDLAENFVVGRDPSDISDIWNDFYYNTFGARAAALYFTQPAAHWKSLYGI